MDNREVAWIESIGQGDARVFDAMVRVFGTNLTRIAAGLLRNREDAQDVVQDVLLRVWEGRAQWRLSVPSRAYLYTATRNQALNLLKRRRVRARYRAEMQLAAEYEPALKATQRSADVFETIEERAAQTVALRRVFATLTERQQAAVRLRYEHELSFPEVAATLGVSVSAAEQLVKRAVRTLRVSMRNGTETAEELSALHVA